MGYFNLTHALVSRMKARRTEDMEQKYMLAQKCNSFVSELIVRDECDRVGAEGKQTSCWSCEIEEDQSVSES